MKQCGLMNFVANANGEETDNTAKFDDKRHLIGMDISKTLLTLVFTWKQRRINGIENLLFSISLSQSNSKNNCIMRFSKY